VQATTTQWVALASPTSNSVLSPIEDVLRRRSFLTGAIAAVGLAACGSGDDNNPDGQSAAGFPRTVDHPMGRAEISAPPQRVVVVKDYHDLDAVLAIGVVPAAFGFAPWLVDDLTPWAAAAGASRSTRMPAPIGEIPLETIAAQRPDLVVAYTVFVGDSFDELSGIAPTVTVEAVSWQTDTRTIGQATGREAQAAAAIDRAELALDQGTATLAELSGRRTAVLSRSRGEIKIATSAHRAGQLVADLGLEPVDLGTSGPEGTLAEEELTRLDDVDILLVQDFVAETDALLNAPLFSRLRPVRERRAARLSPAATRASYLPSALSIPYAAGEFVSAIMAASRGAGSLEPTQGAR
jgi:iron complex transport system substrate-binding protein